jgi:probable HAF family extracellular repeat protein
MQDLGTLGGPDAFAAVVNERGQIAGQSYTSSTPTSSGFPQNNSFLWQNGKMIDLGTLGGTSSFPNALSNRGQVAGQSNLPGDAVFRPFLWDRGTMTDLGTFLGPGPPSYGAANWINDAGEIVGWADNQFNDFAALWKDGVIHNLGSVAGDCYAHANNINSNGQVVGGSGICNVAFVHAFLWENGGPILDLNTLVSSGSGVHLTNAVSINDRGEIASEGLLPNGDQHAFLLIPCAAGDVACEGSAAIATTESSPALVTPARTIAAPENPARGRGLPDQLHMRRFLDRRSIGRAIGTAR